jgi:hypothetical protein
MDFEDFFWQNLLPRRPAGTLRDHGAHWTASIKNPPDGWMRKQPLHAEHGGASCPIKTSLDYKKTAHQAEASGKQSDQAE